MKIKLVVAILFVLGFTTLSGQIVFEKAFGDTLFARSRDMQQTNDSGFIVAGVKYFNYSGSTAVVWLFKTNPSGDLVWSKKYEVPGGFEMEAFSVQQTMDSGYVVSGIMIDTTSGNYIGRIFLIKTNGVGNVSWTKVYQMNNYLGCRLQSYHGNTSVKENLNGYYFINGTYHDLQTNKLKGFLLKTDNSGNLIWSKSYYRPNGMSEGENLQVTNDGGAILVGSDYPLFRSNLLAVRVDSSGIPIWKKSYGIIASDSETMRSYVHVDTIPSGGFILSGCIWDTILGSHTYLLKIDNNGIPIWNNTFSVQQLDEFTGYTVANTFNGGFLLCGTSELISDYDDTYLIKTDANGNLIWNRTYGELQDYYEMGINAMQTFDNGFVFLSENYDINSGVNGPALIKTDSLGNFNCEEQNVPLVAVPKTFWDSVLTIQIDSSIFNDTNFVFVVSIATLDSFNICNQTFVSTISGNDFDVEIFPNPAGKSTTIKFNDPKSSEWNFQLYDSFGKLVLEKMIYSNEEKLDLNLARGIYFYKVTDENKFSAQGKLIVEKGN